MPDQKFDFYDRSRQIDAVESQDRKHFQFPDVFNSSDLAKRIDEKLDALIEASTQINSILAIPTPDEIKIYGNK